MLFQRDVRGRISPDWRISTVSHYISLHWLTSIFSTLGAEMTLVKQNHCFIQWPVKWPIIQFITFTFGSKSSASRSDLRDEASTRLTGVCYKALQNTWHCRTKFESLSLSKKSKEKFKVESEFRGLKNNPLESASTRRLSAAQVSSDTASLLHFFLFGFFRER